MSVDSSEVFVEQVERLGVAEHLVLPGDAFQRAEVLLQHPVLLRGLDTRCNQLLALLGQSIEVDQRPDHGDQQGQAYEPKSYENQAVKRSWAKWSHGGSVSPGPVYQAAQ